MGYTFDVVAAGIDELAIRHPDPKELTLLLARAKAQAVKRKVQEPAVIITSDQVVWFQNKILEKPESEAQARWYLENAHLPADTVSAVVVTNTATGKQVESIDIMTVEMNPFPSELIDAYIKKGDCYNMAGGFDIEDPMIKPYIKAIKGEIESGCGLPKQLTERLLQEVGYTQ